MRHYTILFLTGVYANQKVKVSLPHYYRDGQMITVEKNRARILEMVK